MEYRMKIVLFVALGFTLFGSVTSPFHVTSSSAAPRPTPGDKKAFSDYRGISIGMTTDAVRSKLGGPKDKSDAMDLYMFGESESVQFYYDGSKMVTAIMITFSGDLKNAPLPKDVLGEDVEPKADGAIFKMVRFPKAGFWISYNRTPAPDPIVNIAFQKM